MLQAIRSAMLLALFAAIILTARPVAAQSDLPESAPSGPEKDQVILDDLVVSGSACVGFDCVNNMNFDFDTFVLQENNLRILFNDTSTTAAFPANDWRLIANDSLNGGASYFSLEDATAVVRPVTVMAGAAQNSIFVDAFGNVGLGTDAPADNVTVARNGENVSLALDRTDGAKLQMIATRKYGAIEVLGARPRPFGIVTGGVPRFVVREDGRIGIGTVTPAYLLQLDGGAFSNGATWVNASSRAYKENIRELSDAEAVEAVMSLSPVRFTYKTDSEEEHVGFIAEDVPELVAMKDRNGLSAMDLVAALTKVVQEQQRTIDDLQKRLSNLE